MHWQLTLPAALLLVGTACAPDTTKVQTCDDGSMPATWYIDKDADGYGDEFVTQEACDQPEGYVDLAGDCNDDYEAINPGADEICGDEVDNDCDDGADSDDPDITSSLWYLDADNDGYGDIGTEVETGCPEEGYIAVSGDCNDADDTINPDADDLCDGVDNNCSGFVDDGGDCPCPTETFDGHGYMFCDEPVYFKTATYACQDWGYHLVAMTNAGENNWVKDQALAYALGGPWIGLRDGDADGIYEWENGEPFVYEKLDGR